MLQINAEDQVSKEEVLVTTKLKHEEIQARDCTSEKDRDVKWQEKIL